jgi:hypothetical protein
LHIDQLLLADPATLMHQPPEHAQFLQQQIQRGEIAELLFRGAATHGADGALERIEAQVVKALAKGEALAFRDVRGAVQSPADNLPQERIKRRCFAAAGFVHAKISRLATLAGQGI